MIYGPSLQKIPSEDAINTSTGNIWNLISGKTAVLPEDRLPLFCDTRDVSRAHILALEKPESVGHRVPLCGGAFTWQQAADYLQQVRPEIADKLLDTVDDLVNNHSKNW
jgi:nucleoside-diphosphate-sugar epimerase